MQDLGFIIAAYGVILGGLAIYAGLLLRRLAAARAVARTRPGDGCEVTPPEPDSRA